MTITRKVELGSGVVTGLFGVIVALYLFSQDYEAAKRLSEEYPLFQGLAVALFSL